MRILFATDGSIHADTAVELLRGISWPDGSTIRVVSVMPRSFDLAAVTWATASSESATREPDERRRHHEDLLDAAVRNLSRPRLIVERFLLWGRPASSIVEEAAAWGADLVVVGHRGRGTMASMLLGSVSAEVVDHAPCPVLVVRRPTLRSVLFATDGSPSATHAEELLASWPIFAGRPLRVVAVAETGYPWTFGTEADGLTGGSTEMSLESTRADRRLVAEATVGRMTEAGRMAAWEVLEGSPATAIVAALEEHGDDLVVIGSRGHAGLARLLTGSVARNVLIHAPTNVLIVRQAARVAREPEPAVAVELS
jgi:nucleotide-binding universal stress UspA family protein